MRGSSCRPHPRSFRQPKDESVDPQRRFGACSCLIIELVQQSPLAFSVSCDTLGHSFPSAPLPPKYHRQRLYLFFFYGVGLFRCCNEVGFCCTPRPLLSRFLFQPIVLIQPLFLGASELFALLLLAWLPSVSAAWQLWHRCCGQRCGSSNGPR